MKTFEVELTVKIDVEAENIEHACHAAKEIFGDENIKILNIIETSEITE